MTENSLKRLDKFKSIHSSRKNILNSTITTSRKTEETNSQPVLREHSKVSDEQTGNRRLFDKHQRVLNFYSSRNSKQN